MLRVGLCWGLCWIEGSAMARDKHNPHASWTLTAMCPPWPDKRWLVDGIRGKFLKSRLLCIAVCESATSMDYVRRRCPTTMIT